MLNTRHILRKLAVADGHIRILDKTPNRVLYECRAAISRDCQHNQFVGALVSNEHLAVYSSMDLHWLAHDWYLRNRAPCFGMIVAPGKPESHFCRISIIVEPCDINSAMMQ